MSLLTSFRTAADEMDVTLGEVPYLLAYRIGGEAKDDFVQQTNEPHGSAVGAKFLLTIFYPMTRYAPKDALHTAEVALRTVKQRHDESERAFCKRLMRLGRQIMGMYDPGQLRYLFLKGLHPSVQAQAELANRTCTTFDELLALLHKIRDGLRAVKVTIGTADRHTTAKRVLQLGSRSGAKIEPVLWAAPPATTPDATPPPSRHPMGRPPPQQPFQAFTPTAPEARTQSTGTETPWARRQGVRMVRPAMVPLSQVQCHHCRGFSPYARACPSPDRTLGPRAPPATAPGPPGARRPALCPSRMQYAMAAIAGDPWGAPLAPDDTGSLSGGGPVGAAPGDSKADPDPKMDRLTSPGPGNVHGACR